MENLMILILLHPLYWDLFCLFEHKITFSFNSKLLHGNISPHSIWVVHGGSWKLTGFEWCCILINNEADYYYYYDNSGPYSELFPSLNWAAYDWGSVSLAQSILCVHIVLVF